MSSEGLIIEERSRDIGNFLVGRLIPFRKKRMVGPFIFIDHMGPSQVGPNKYLDVDQHPHIGLWTLTYLFEGEIMHADSLGTYQKIVPGSVNLMVAGRGVTHTERTPEDSRNGAISHMHGFQIWIALPKGLEEIEPAFEHVDVEALPKWEDGAAEFTLVAGTGYGKSSPVKTFSNLFMVEIKTTGTYTLDVKDSLTGEIGICIIKGKVHACDDVILEGNMIVSKIEDVCEVTLEADTHVLLFGGQPFEEERHIYWNFVSSDKERLESAKQRWKNKDFPSVPNDNTYVVMPE